MSDLQHCKGSGHVSIAGSSIPPVAHAPELGATYEAAYHCHQDPEAETEVIVLAPVARPDDGLHLLREVWAYVSGNLRAMAATYLGGSVEIRHTVQGVMTTRWTLASSAARELADEMSSIMAAHS